jgi:ATP-dependent Clp protease adaptor protein ClpS
MEFVIMVLMDVFYKTEEEAERLMLEVHNNGSAIVGRYTWDIACTKQQRVQVLAAQEEFPLRVTIEQE